MSKLRDVVVVRVSEKGDRARGSSCNQRSSNTSRRSRTASAGTPRWGCSPPPTTNSSLCSAVEINRSNNNNQHQQPHPGCHPNRGSSRQLRPWPTASPARATLTPRCRRSDSQISSGENTNAFVLTIEYGAPVEPRRRRSCPPGPGTPDRRCRWGYRLSRRTRGAGGSCPCMSLTAQTLMAVPRRPRSQADVQPRLGSRPSPQRGAWPWPHARRSGSSAGRCATPPR
jgi:hypothetical protein